MADTSQFLNAGGGGIPINGMLPLNENNEGIVEKDGATYLRSGLIETNPSVYPDAYYGVVSAEYLSSHSLTNEPESEEGFTSDGSFYYIVSDAEGRLYKYNTNGVYQGRKSLPSLGFVWQVRDITSDGTYLWVLQGGNSIGKDTLYRFNTNMDYTNFNIPINTSNVPLGVLYVGGLLLVDQGDVNNTVIGFNTSGTVVLEEFIPNVNLDFKYSCWDGQHIYQSGQKYSFEDNDFYATDYNLGFSEGLFIAWDGSNFATLVPSNRVIDKYAPVNGTGIPYRRLDGGTTIYTRVK